MVPHLKVWLSGPDAGSVFGDGKWRLLVAIREQGSLSAGCGALGMSYRKAWGELRKAEERLGVALVESQRGGHSRGRTCLTAHGEELASAYSTFRARLDQSAAQLFDEHVGPILRDLGM